MNKNVLVIYHANCTDGFAAAFSAWLKFGDSAEYKPMSYKEESLDAMAELVRHREVYVLDFSFSRLVTEHMILRAKKFVWLDHHKTAFETWCGGIPNNELYMKDGLDDAEGTSDNYQIILDNNKSGALIAWEYFHPDAPSVPLLIQHIDDRDRWQFKLPGSKELHASLASLAPWAFDQWMGFIQEGQITELISAGRGILRAHNQNVATVVKSASRACVLRAPTYAEEKYTGLAVNCSAHLASDVGHELATASGTYGLIWYVGQDGKKAKCSLRSNGDYDVSAIAAHFGGGGHKNAAGFEVDLQTLLAWL